MDPDFSHGREPLSDHHRLEVADRHVVEGTGRGTRIEARHDSTRESDEEGGRRQAIPAEDARLSDHVRV